MELTVKHILSFFLILHLLLLGNTMNAGSPVQDSLLVKKDSLDALLKLKQAETLTEEGQYDTACLIVESVLETAIEQSLEPIEADSYYLLGRIKDRTGNNWELTLRYFLKAKMIYEGLDLRGKIASVNQFLASKYYDLGVYSKSAAYYTDLYSLYEDGVDGDPVSVSYNIAVSYFRDRRYREAMPWFEKSGALSYGKGVAGSRINSLFGLTSCAMGLNDYDAAEKYLHELMPLLENTGQYESLAEAYSMEALVYFERKDYSRAIDLYLKSVEILQESDGAVHEVYTNAAICYQNLENSGMASRYFELALSDARKQNDKRGMARLEHIMAVVSENKEDYYHADYYCNAAIEDAMASSSYDILQECYLTYSEVLETGNDFVKALEYYEKYLSLRDSLLVEERLAGQAEEQRRADLENLEQQLLLSLSDEELKDIMIDKLKVENEKRDNELKLMERERELEKSERERLEQSMVLAREKYNREMQEQQIHNLEQERAIQRLELLRQENEEKELLRKNQLQESEIKQQQLEIEKEHEARKRLIWMAVLLGIIVILILVSFISSRRKNIILSEQKNEISLQKDIIEEKNMSITDSIEYASRIQSAVLPVINFLDEWGMDNFILFKPKDIVSGDFYWGQRKGHLLSFAAADCTGHGVPGAFMSMLGNAYLNDIINSREFDNAGDILNQLRKEVMFSLKQKGEEGEAQDGMDISLCLYNIKDNILDFAGANNPLYIIRDDKLERIDADKMPIGIHRSYDKPFTNHRIKPEKGDLIYLFSDGYADQFGGTEGKKFKYRAFRDMLLREHKRPMKEQGKMLEAAFDEWRGEIEQVDDVLVIGVKF